MNAVGNLQLFSQLTFYVLMFFMGLFSVLIFFWQIMVLRGRAMNNADGSCDDWSEQKNFWGIAFADVFIACPVTFAGIALVFTGLRCGFYMLALVGFWFIWANTMTTANSLRFENPKITLSWLFTFPMGIFIGGGYILWTIVHFDTIFAI